MPGQAWPADQCFSVSSTLKTFHGPWPGSACSISFACAQSVQTETSSKATAIALACGHGLALYSLGRCIAMASTTYLLPVVRMIVDKAYTEPGTWLSAEIVGHWASLANCRNVPSGSCGRRKHGHWPLELRVLCAGLLSDCIWRIPKGKVLSGSWCAYDVASRDTSWPSIAQEKHGPPPRRRILAQGPWNVFSDENMEKGFCERHDFFSDYIEETT